MEARQRFPFANGRLMDASWPQWNGVAAATETTAIHRRLHRHLLTLLLLLLLVLLLPRQQKSENSYESADDAAAFYNPTLIKAQSGDVTLGML